MTGQSKIGPMPVDLMHLVVCCVCPRLSTCIEATFGAIRDWDERAGTHSVDFWLMDGTHIHIKIESSQAQDDETGEPLCPIVARCCQ